MDRDQPRGAGMSLGQIDSVLFEPWLPLEQWLYLPISQVLQTGFLRWPTV
jgi:hypothetical protein